MGGKVANKLGDGLMALFGYPVAQENDAERALRAALAIQRVLVEQNRKNEGSGKPVLAARIAIESGPVVVDAAGEIFGDVPNIAARAQALAEPGSVVVTVRVQRQVAGLFVAEERGSHELKGVPEPVALFRLIRASGGGRRAGQRHLTPLVGRDEEMPMFAARHALPKEVVDGVTERTGGVPLFVEEVTRLLLEGGTQGGIQAIPPTLQQSLTARLDRLGPAREVAQIGAVIGRDFSYALVRAVAGMEDAPLQAALERLAEADILLVQGLPPESHYRFKHALIQDAAYENLLKSRRQVLHRRIAEVLRDKFADSAGGAWASLHASWIERTGDRLVGKAGDQALHRSAYVEAIGHLGKAIDMTEKLAAATSAAPQGSQRLRLQIAYGNAR
jgi:hypothetical protein